ncbi:hypothetical protein HDU85_005503 [Gaertneriomyces sp. JEL0708]|nr:hypothetical protein HDU85_005503 [Gaertneriomyces sp. JEL0708]
MITTAPSTQEDSHEQNGTSCGNCSPLAHLLEANKARAKTMHSAVPTHFPTMASGQSPQYMYIGCSDSRVVPTDIGPGDMFVHRNIANVFISSDVNLLSVLQYAVDYLKVKHIIVCGHYNCGGVQGALSTQQLGGILDIWLRPIKDMILERRAQIEAVTDEQERWDLVCEMNVLKSVHGVCHTTTVLNAWERGQELTVHGWCYRLKDGRVRDLKIDVTSPSTVDIKFTKLIKQKLRPEYATEKPTSN